MLGSLYAEEYEFSNSEDENHNSGAYVSDLQKVKNKFAHQI